MSQCCQVWTKMDPFRLLGRLALGVGDHVPQATLIAARGSLNCVDLLHA